MSVNTTTANATVTAGDGPPPENLPPADPSAAARPRVLMVDDEPLVLAGYRRAVGRSFDLTVADGGAAALAAIAAGPEFAVIVTDMRMPRMDGIAFIAAARAASRDSTFVMLTGNADQQTAVDAVNKGHIFRFLNKPCSGTTLSAALADAVRQHELVTAERVLLRDTITGSIRLLSDALEMADPDLFRCQSAVREMMRDVCRAVGVEHTWRLSIAASVCLVGLVTVPRRPGTDELSDEVLAVVAATGGRLLSNVPRLMPVATMVRLQRDPGRLPDDLTAASGQDAERAGAQLLRFCVDLAREERRSTSRSAALQRLAATQQYDRRLTAALVDRSPASPAAVTVRSVSVGHLSAGMIVDEDVRRRDGVLLLSCGQAISELAACRLRNFALVGDVRPAVNVRFEQPAPPGVPAEHH